MLLTNKKQIRAEVLMFVITRVNKANIYIEICIKFFIILITKSHIDCIVNITLYFRKYKLPTWVYFYITEINFLCKPILWTLRKSTPFWINGYEIAAERESLSALSLFFIPSMLLRETPTMIG